MQLDDGRLSHRLAPNYLPVNFLLLGSRSPDLEVDIQLGVDKYEVSVGTEAADAEGRCGDETVEDDAGVFSGARGLV